ncbi:MAG: DUF1592 domain-containing protein [Luteolibacter sp.]
MIPAWGMVFLGGVLALIPAARAVDYEKTIRPLMEAYCYDCHGDEEKPKGGVNLERFSSEALALRDRNSWAGVLEKVESLQMPPPKKKSQPTKVEREELLAWIRELAARPDPVLGVRDPGKPVLRRLTRLEYNNSVRDVFGLKNDIFMFPERLPVNGDYFHPELSAMPDPMNVTVREYGLKYAVLLPDAGLPGENRAEHGFGNRGEAMNLSPLLLEKYLGMARAIVSSPKLVRQSTVFRELVTDPAMPERVRTPAGLSPHIPVFMASADFAPNVDRPREATNGGAATVTYQFRFNASTAVQEGTGGVWDAEARDLKLSARSPVAVKFGLAKEKILRITPRQDLWVAGFSTAEETSGQSLFTNGVKANKVFDLDLTVDGGEHGEAIVDLAVCVLGRAGEKGVVSLTATFTDGSAKTLMDDIPEGEGIGNTFYSFRAPEGQGITSLHVDGGGFSGNYVLLDDLGFITDGGKGDPLVSAGALRPMAPEQKRGIAGQRMVAFLTKLFRHPLNPETLPRYMALYDAAVKNDRSFADAMRDMVAAALTSPEFLYFTSPAETGKEPVRKLDPFETATRLSYFLWCAPPDDALREDALSGKLGTEAGIEAAVARMTHDPRIRELAESFAVQWLRLDQLYTAKPDPKLFPVFYSGQAGKRTLHAPMLVEALLLFQTVLVENRSIIDFIDPGYTWVNLKLVKLYGLEAGNAERIQALGLRQGSTDELVDLRMNNVWWRAKLPDKSRGGFMTMGGPLTVTSLPVRTSPVKRGAWLLESMFNRPPQEPKVAFVLKGDDQPEATAMSVRQRFEAHRNEPACYSCHVRLDPPGFALEAFDPVGAFRTSDGGQPVDARAEWHGTAFDSPAGFKAAVVANQDEFVRGFIEHLLGYALGRKLELYDQPAVEEIQRAAAADHYRLRSILMGVAKSYPFLHTRTS